MFYFTIIFMILSLISSLFTSRTLTPFLTPYGSDIESGYELFWWPLNRFVRFSLSVDLSAVSTVFFSRTILAVSIYQLAYKSCQDIISRGNRSSREEIDSSAIFYYTVQHKHSRCTYTHPYERTHTNSTAVSMFEV